MDSVGSGYVTAFGQGLHFGSSGKGCDFTVVGGGGKSYHLMSHINLKYFKGLLLLHYSYVCYVFCMP